MAQRTQAPFPAVRGDVHTPKQRGTSSGLETATYYNEFCTLKHLHPSECHSYAEYLHLGLLEGDPSVESFVPQPFMLRVGGRRYTPDCWWRRVGRQIVGELRPGGSMDEAMRIPLEKFFLWHGMEFRVISNESVLEREIEALNWIEIVHTLYTARELDTQAVEQDIYTRLGVQAFIPLALGELVEATNRERTYYHEVAVFRLMHRGLLTADIKDAYLDWDTAVYRAT